MCSVTCEIFMTSFTRLVQCDIANTYFIWIYIYLMAWLYFVICFHRGFCMIFYIFNNFHHWINLFYLICIFYFFHQNYKMSPSRMSIYYWSRVHCFKSAIYQVYVFSGIKLNHAIFWSKIMSGPENMQGFIFSGLNLILFREGWIQFVWVVNRWKNPPPPPIF